jgi:hypothetical protein
VKSLEAFEPERLVVCDPIDERSQSTWVDPVVDEATITSFGHKSSATERGQVLGDSRLREVEARRQVLKS